MIAVDRPIDVSFVIPVWNEEGNVGRLLQRQQELVRELGLSAEWWVVDKGSTDATVAEARAAGATVVTQEAPGYGGALATGFSRSRGVWVVTCDGDLSHDPAHLRAALPPPPGVDVVIFSRYVEGGGTDQPEVRQRLSRLLNAVFRICFRVPIHDMSSGYRIYRGEKIRRLRFRSVDFDVLEEILVLLHRSGARIIEVPFHFRDRECGTSKVCAGLFAPSYLRTLTRLKLAPRRASS